MLERLGIFITLICCFFISTSANSAPLSEKKPTFNIILFKPQTGDYMPFWVRTGQFASYVAADLKINFKTISIDNNKLNSIENSEFINAYLQKHKPDAVISYFALTTAHALLGIIEKHQVPFISINSSINQTELKQIGLPRENYKYWLAHISPDDVGAGARLSAILTSKLKVGQEANLLAVNGIEHTPATLERSFGLTNSRFSGSVFELVQHLNTDWSSHDSKIKTSMALERHNNIDINLIWTAGDLIAQGAIEALEQYEKIPGKDFFVATIDWNQAAMTLLEEKKIEASLGGHFTEAGAATILLHDYLNGYDFKDDTGLVIKTQMQVMSQNNYRKIKARLKQRHWLKLDFKNHSKYHSPTLKRYKLTPRNLLKL